MTVSRTRAPLPRYRKGDALTAAKFNLTNAAVGINQEALFPTQETPPPAAASTTSQDETSVTVFATSHVPQDRDIPVFDVVGPDPDLEIGTFLAEDSTQITFYIPANTFGEHGAVNLTMDLAILHSGSGV